jgi:hypothetical protein
MGVVLLSVVAWLGCLVARHDPARARQLPRAAGARFAPYAAARNLPNIVVDGAPLPSTLLNLAHWPNNQSPPAVRRDTSTATVFAWLDAADLHQSIPWVTNNHFDEDGLFGMYALTEPERALRDRDLLIAASYAGDFGVVTDRGGAPVLHIEALTDPEASRCPPTSSRSRTASPPCTGPCWSRCLTPPRFPRRLAPFRRSLGPAGRALTASLASLPTAS